MAQSDRLAEVLAPFERLAGQSSCIVKSPLGPAGISFELPRFIFLGRPGGGDPVNIGIFAGIHGDEPAGIHASARFAQQLVENEELGRGYRVFFYPICNPAGFLTGSRHSRSGKDLNREFWKNSQEPEVRSLEKEIRDQHFHGLISLHSDDTSDGIYGYVRGAVLTRALLVPALAAAERVLPRNSASVIDGFPAEQGIISECYEGILTSPPDLHPLPFETILETPHAAPMEAQVQALVLGLQSILTEYQKFLSFAANL